MARERQTQRATAIPWNQCQTESPTPLTDSISNEASSSSLLTRESQAPTNGLKSIPGLEPTPAPTPPMSTKELFKLFMQTYMNTVKNQVQAHVQAPAPPVQFPTPPVEPKEQPFKARFPDLYFGKSHLDRYLCCQLCEDHFNMARANGDNCIPFANFFLRDAMSTRGTQYKCRHVQEKGSDVVIPLEEFKAFLYKNCGNSRTFVKDI